MEDVESGEIPQKDMTPRMPSSAPSAAREASLCAWFSSI